jgi:hypothetical protein
VKEALRQFLIMAIAAIAFSALFILGHLAIYQTLPRWK